MFNRIKVLSVFSALIVLGFIMFVQWPASKAQVANENLRSVLKKLEGSTLTVKKGNSSAVDGRVVFVGEDYIQSGQGTYYPFTAIVSAAVVSTTHLIIEVR